MQHADAEGEGDAVRRVLDVEEDLDARRRSRSFMPPRCGSGRRLPGPGSGRATAGRRRLQRSPNFSESAGRAGRELADHGDRQVPHDRDVPELRRTRSRRHGQQQLVVLAAVQGERRSRRPALLLEPRPRRDRRAGPRASIQAETSLSSQSVSRSPDRPSERSMAACTMSCSRQRAAEGQRRRRDRAARAGSGSSGVARATRVQMPGRSRAPVLVEARAPSEERRPAAARAQRARDHDEVARLRRPRAGAARSPCPSSVTSMTSGPGVAATLPPTRSTPASAARSSSPS